MNVFFRFGRLCLSAAVGLTLIMLPAPAASASPQVVAADPPHTCHTVENYSKYQRRWMKAHACLRVKDDKPTMYFWAECQIQDKTTAYRWHYEDCNVNVIYSLSKDGKELTDGRLYYRSVTDGEHDIYQAYDCQGYGRYTLHVEQNSYGTNAFGQDDPAYTETTLRGDGC